MPPKPKFTREELITAALDLVSEKGISALTAKEIGDRLGISARPVFTAFRNMEEVQQEVRKAAYERFRQRTRTAADYTPAFKQMGMQMVLFAKEEPNLYHLLFLTNDGAAHQMEEGFLTQDDIAKNALKTIQQDYHLSEEDARNLFHHTWIFTFGIGTLYATGVCQFSEEEVSELLTQNFRAVLKNIQTGQFQQPAVQPEPKKSQG